MKTQDLSLVGTKDLYAEIARRYDASTLLLVRGEHLPAPGEKRGSGQVTGVKVLCRDVTDIAGFLRSVSELVEHDALRDLGEDDL